MCRKQTGPGPKTVRGIAPRWEREGVGDDVALDLLKVRW